MDPITYSAEMTSSIPPARLFKAAILDHHLLPKVVPQAIKNVEILEGDGGAGTIKKFPEYPFKSDKHRVETLDKDDFVYCYSVIESDALKEGIEKFTNEIKFEASPDGGSICKTTSRPALSTPRVMSRSLRKKSREENKGPWDCSRLLRLTSSQILMPTTN
ncbi:unnamed protein product [Coffea canephora]|uniref:Bet v I/Major latex protein domain-containing protein n=1 Tax=Coffea canephora TaxID=49390 RepID=A0A068UPG2_COFCA|nr:unnamed protein product [Coffea canephora]